MVTAYETTYRRWIEDPEGFWAHAAESIHWYKKWDQVLDASNTPFYAANMDTGHAPIFFTQITAFR